jgi:hypothetical protein
MMQTSKDINCSYCGRSWKESYMKDNHTVLECDGAPTWFIPGIKCRVWITDKGGKVERIIVWFKDYCGYLDYEGKWWKYAEPMESWYPQKGEYYAFWDTSSSRGFIVKQFDHISINTPRVFTDVDNVYWEHIADISGIDANCSLIELKRKANWL